MAEKQIIEGGSLLSSIVKLLFGGIDNILDSMAEYEEEMGVLKQINKILITDGNTNYTLTVKIAPVRDKEGVFFVEAQTDAPKFDVSSINEKAMKLNNSTKDAFSKMISKLIILA